tara:strand:+ start:4653 stop:5762 length:1110 start_codon:yes stop_codon:yes gene_type:complete
VKYANVTTTTVETYATTVMNHGSVVKMWTEHYRPTDLDSVVGQDHIIRPLKHMVTDLHDGKDTIPHMAFYGIAGTGKTTAAIAFMKSAFGDAWDSNWLELNASDERSISVIRQKVKDFAKRGTIGTFTNNKGNEMPIPFNMVFLDEADNLTPEAQSALRRMMEKYPQTRFILSANYPHKIISPIHDRCAFSNTRFRPIDAESMTMFLQNVIEQENKKVSTDALEHIVSHSRGSLRKALNLLWSLTRVPMLVEAIDVTDFVVTLDPVKTKTLLAKTVKAAKAKPEDSIRLWREVDKAIDNLADRGMSGAEILDSIYRLASEDDKMPIKLKSNLFHSIGDGLYWVSVAQDDMLAVKAFFRRFSSRNLNIGG